MKGDSDFGFTQDRELPHPPNPKPQTPVGFRVFPNPKPKLTEAWRLSNPKPQRGPETQQPPEGPGHRKQALAMKTAVSLSNGELRLWLGGGGKSGGDFGG